MGKQVTANNVVKNFFAESYGTTTKRKLENDFGRMFKSISGEGWYEVGTSFFYRTNNSTAALVEELREYAAKFGLTVESSGRIEFRQKEWPKTSWAVSMVFISDY